MLTFTVYGVAQPKGNMRAFQGRGMKHPIVTDSNRGIRSWSQLVAQGASDAMRATPGAQLLTGPVRVSVAFSLPRPKQYDRAGLEVAHTKAPDLDKLLRGVLDALSAVAFRDDSQVVEVLAQKGYADRKAPPHVTITVEPTKGTRPLAVTQPPLFELIEA